MKPLSKAFSQNRRCDCGTRMTNRNKSGRCRRCNLRVMHSDPEIAMRRGETIRKRCEEDPLYRARRAAIMRANHAAALMDPDKRAKIVAAARRNIPNCNTPEARAKRAAGQAEANRQQSERKMGWCPPEWRDTYRLLIRKHYHSTEARQMVLAQIAEERAKLSPFERQMRALENGARLVANDRGPMFGEALKAVGE